MRLIRLKIQRPILLASLLLILFSDKAFCGPYLNSAHGNSTYGVKRDVSGFPGYATGLCAHCHEQHAGIGGAEPVPIGGTPSKYLLFYDNYLTQTDGFCFKCHKDVDSYQSGSNIVNRSYSYRAGGWVNDTVNDILESFSFTSPDSSHSLDDIKTFFTGKWGYTANSNPCNACHNPHAAQGDPPNAPNSFKSAVSRGWPVSRPSAHSYNNNTWTLWGNDAVEKMNNYTAGYQAPYRFDSSTTYEPDGSTTQDGSNLTDYVTFCTDCHNDVNTIYSTALGRNLYQFNWTAVNPEKHGKRDADGAISLDNPYSSVIGKVLNCTDCHEPHGSHNQVLIREEVNGAILAGAIGTITSTDCTAQYTDTDIEMSYLCNRCHKDDYEFDDTCGQNRYYKIHHDNASTDPPYNPIICGDCHATGAGTDCSSTWSSINCNCCHYHGSSVTDATNAPAGRKTF